MADIVYSGSNLDKLRKWKISAPRDVPRTSVGQESILAVSPFRKIWWRKSTVSELRKMELMSSWEHGGLLLLAAIFIKNLSIERKYIPRLLWCHSLFLSATTLTIIIPTNTKCLYFRTRKTESLEWHQLLEITYLV